MLREVAFSQSRWSEALGIIDELLDIHGSALVFGEGKTHDDVRIHSAWMYERGERRTDVEHEYLQDFHHIDERIPRLRLAPDSRIFHITEFYTEQELKSSPAFNGRHGPLPGRRRR